MATIMNLYVAIIAISAVTHTTLCAKLSNRRQIEDSPLYTFTDYVTVKSQSTSSTAQTSFNAHDVVGVEDFQSEFPNSNSNEDTDDDDDDDITDIRSENIQTIKSTTISTKSIIMNKEKDEKSKQNITEGPPIFSEDLTRIVAKPTGNMAKIRCLSRGKPEPNITWTKDNGPIERTVGKVSYTKWAIILEDLTSKDSGNYMCKVCNIHGCISHSFRLIVQDRVNHTPIIRDPPKNTTLRIGSSTNLTCAYISDLHNDVQWIYSKKCANCSDRIKLKLDQDEPEVLKLKNVTHADEGWYTCVAVNSLGHTAASAYLRVVDQLDEQSVLAAEQKFNPVWGYVSASALGLLFLGATLIMYCGYTKLKHEKMQKHRAMETVHQWTKKVIIVNPSKDEVDGDNFATQIPIVRIEKQRTTLIQTTNDAAVFNEYEFPLDSNWEFGRSQLRLGPTLGEGAFGRVVMAEAFGMNKSPTKTIVAVKMVKEGHTDSDMTSLVREMEVMKMIGKHINIINLLGCCSQDGPLYVIVEYAPHGNLKDFLKKNRAMAEYDQLNSQRLLSQKELTSFAYQVARGMEYLASRRCIHRDLAARNVLVCDDYIVKIADFGLARDLQESEYYRKNTNGRLPIKWMAPESLRDKFYDSQSDVWSYGVLLWEIMTFGEQPYPQIYNSEYLYDYLKSGNRMEKPYACPINIYALTRQCWNWKPNSRPTFTEIVDTLDKILTSTSNEEYLQLDNITIQNETCSVQSDDEDNENDDEFNSATPLRTFMR